MLPETSKRVKRNTVPSVNEKVMKKTANNIEYFSKRGRLVIDRRLQELDREWDVERALETNASVLALAGMLLSFRNRRWMILPMGAVTFLLQHALQGWCPPVPVLRRMGVRTVDEIDYEKRALQKTREQGWKKVPRRRRADSRAESIPEPVGAA